MATLSGKLATLAQRYEIRAQELAQCPKARTAYTEGASTLRHWLTTGRLTRRTIAEYVGATFPTLCSIGTAMGATEAVAVYRLVQRDVLDICEKR